MWRIVTSVAVLNLMSSSIIHYYNEPTYTKENDHVQETMESHQISIQEEML